MKHNNSGNNPWMICLRIGSHGVVGGSRHFKSWEQADVVRKQMVNSPSVRAQANGSVGVLVMHYKKFQELCGKGEACTIARIKANELAMPDLANVSLAANQLQDIDTDQMQAWRDHCKKYAS